MLIKFDFVTFMTFKQIHNSDLYCFVFDGNQVGVAMQRLAFVDSIRPRNAGRTQIVTAVNCADAGKVGRNIYNNATQQIHQSVKHSLNHLINQIQSLATQIAYIHTYLLLNVPYLSLYRMLLRAGLRKPPPCRYYVYSMVQKEFFALRSDTFPQ